MEISVVFVNSTAIKILFEKWNTIELLNEKWLPCQLIIPQTAKSKTQIKIITAIYKCYMNNKYLLKLKWNEKYKNKSSGFFSPRIFKISVNNKITYKQY